jgi:ABC-type Na+ efflux pump permease subunit
VTLAVVLDIVVALLLVAAIIAAFILNRRFAAFREAKAEFEQVIERFNLAAARAEGGVNGLKNSADATGASLQQSINQAQALRNELDALVRRAEGASSALAIAARGNAASAVAPEPVRAPRPSKVASDTDLLSPDLLKSLSSLR